MESLRNGRSGIVSLGADFPLAPGHLPTGAIIQPEPDFPDAGDLHPRISPRYARALGGFCRSLQQLVQRVGPPDRVYLIYRRHFYSEWPDASFEVDEDAFLGRFLQRCGLAVDSQELVLLHGACSSGLVALNLAVRQVQREPGLKILVIGLESELNPERFLSIKKLGAISSETDPRRSCQPFSTYRTGLVPGEVMVAALVGARPYGSLTSGDILLIPGMSTSDASRLTDCLESGEYLRECLSRPLEGLQGKLDFVCPHGTSTPLNDRVEGQVLNEFFRDQAPMKLIPLKGYLGHTLNSSGLWEAILNGEFLRHNFLPALGNVDPLEPLTHLEFLRAPYEGPLSRCLKLAIGFGGINSSLLLEKVG